MPVDISVTLHQPSIQVSGTAGDVTFAATSFTWGADNSASIGSATSGAGAGKVTFSEATLTKNVDNQASPLFFRLLGQGGHLDTVTVELRKAGGAPGGAQNQPPWITISFRLVAVTHFDQSIAGGNEVPQETVHLEYGAVQMTVNNIDATGKITTPATPVAWNRITNSSSLDIPAA